MRKLLFLLSLSTALAGAAQAETVSILMEGVPDTEYVKALIPDFEKETGISVNLEVVNYAEMHTKLVPQLVARQGGYSAIVVDFYWVGEFTKAGWLQPLIRDRHHRVDNVTLVTVENLHHVTIRH